MNKKKIIIHSIFALFFTALGFVICLIIIMVSIPWGVMDIDMAIDTSDGRRFGLIDLTPSDDEIVNNLNESMTSKEIKKILKETDIYYIISDIKNE